jgi:hypothetical protein
MASFPSRYQRGEREQVWAELRNLHGAVREERYLDDAWAVAVETMQRVRRNVETLIDRLTVSGYEFGEYSKPPLSPPEKHPGLVDFHERGIFTLGLSAKAWIEVVGEVNLSGDHPDSDEVDLYANALAVEFEQREEFIEREVQDEEVGFAHVIETTIEIESLDQLPQQGIYVGSDMWYDGRDGWQLHRHEILVPDKSADATIDLDDRQMFFVDYLRHTFKWGGFPSFERYGFQPHDELVTSLAKELLPI